MTEYFIHEVKIDDIVFRAVEEYLYTGSIRAIGPKAYYKNNEGIGYFEIKSDEPVPYVRWIDRGPWQRTHSRNPPEELWCTKKALD